MDEKALNELLECSVCLDRLDASSKVLPCQHTFCRWCLEEIVCTKKELRCPECRCLVDIKISDLPTNILLIRLLEGMKNAARSSGSSTKSSPSRISDKMGSGPASPTHACAEGGPPSPQHKVIDITNQPCAKALYNYDASEPGDLSFQKSDIILLRKQVDENWYHGELNGKHGFFPASYVQIVTPMSNKEIPSCKALYDFTDQKEKDCLTFKKDVTMTVIRRVDDNWVEGKLGDNIGIFPKAFVELNDAAKMLMNLQASLLKSKQDQTNDLNSQSMRSNPLPTHPNVSSTPIVALTTAPIITCTSSQNLTASANQQQTLTASANQSPSPSPTLNLTSMQSKPNTLNVNQHPGNKRHSLHALSPSRATHTANRRSMEIPSNVDLSSVAMVTSTPVSTTPSPRDISSTMSSPENQTSQSSLSIYVALYTYKPHKDDELDLVKGDFYSVTEKCQDGWYKGICLRTGIKGVFPGNYVQPVKMTQSRSGIGLSRSPSCVSAMISHNASVSSSLDNTDHQRATPASMFASLSTTTHLTHVNVTRTHSFPKTSPVALMDYGALIRNKARLLGSQGLVRTSSTSNHPRPITNITQAQMRSAQSAANTSVAQSRSHSMLIPTSVIMSTGAPSCYHPSGVIGDQDEERSQSLPTGISPQQAYQNSQAVLRALSTSANSKHSPHSPRTNADKTSKQFANQCSATKQKDNQTSPNPCSNKVTPPPNMVIGATGGEAESPTREKSKKKDKDRLPVSLMKKLSAQIPIRVRKSKSPIPEAGTSGASSNQLVSPLAGAASVAKPSSSQSPHHNWSGSAPSECSPSRVSANHSNPSGHASAAHGHGMMHKKSQSVDSSHHNGKPAKIKPLVRDRYRCFVPYPPQSDLELELKLGEIVYVYKKREDGWFKGTLQSSGKSGLFPGSFVEKC